MILNTERKDSSGSRKSTWALGYGRNSADALQDAIEEMGRRDWGWSKQKHGYTVSDQGSF